MFVYTQKQKAELMVLDIYKSAITLSFVSGEGIVNKSKSLEYLKVQYPKEKLHTEAVKEALIELINELGSENIKLPSNYIFVILHGKYSKSKTTEYFVNLHKNIKLNYNIILETIKKYQSDPSAFLDSAYSNFIKTIKLSYNISPNFYFIRNWKGKFVSKFSFVLLENFVDKELYETINTAISETLPGREVFFITPDMYLHNTTVGLETFFVVDIGAEFITVKQVYNTQILAQKVYSFSVNEIIRDIARHDLGSFELAESSLISYLHGSCSSHVCSLIEKIIKAYVNRLKAELKNSNFKDFLKGSLLYMHNPMLHDEVIKWVISEFKNELGTLGEPQRIDKGKLLTELQLDLKNIIHKDKIMILH